MMSQLVEHWGVLRSSFRRIFHSRLGGFFNILVIGISLSLPAGMYVVLQSMQGLVTQLSATPQISLFLSMNATPGDVDTLRRQLAQHTNIAHFEFVGRDDALAQLKKSTGLVDVIGTLQQNPLPDAFVIYPKPAEAHELEALRDELGRLSDVAQAQLDSAWAYKLEALLKFGRMTVVILSSLLSLALVAITFNTIRLQILTKSSEIEVSKLIGATNAFIRRPFLYFGAIQGLLGGVMACLIVIVSVLLLNYELRALAQLYSSQFTLHPLSISDSISLLLFSMYLGWLGAWLSVGRHLSQVEPR